MSVSATRDREVMTREADDAVADDGFLGRQQVVVMVEKMATLGKEMMGMEALGMMAGGGGRWGFCGKLLSIREEPLQWH